MGEGRARPRDHAGCGRRDRDGHRRVYARGRQCRGHATDPRFSGFAAHRLGDYRGALAVPMDRDGEIVGVITLSRPEARRFTERQVALVKAFADQAVIAIENVRLFDEVQARTRDLTEALQQQTATAKVLEVISRSAFDLSAVFETVAESSVRLCGADRAFIFRFDGEMLRMAVAFNASAEFVEFVRQNPFGQAGTAVRRAPHSSAGRSTFPMFAPIPNIPTARRTSN